MATSKLRKIILLVETICAIEKTNGVPKKTPLKLGPCMIAGTLFPCGTWLDKKETFIDVEEKYSDSWVGKDKKNTSWNSINRVWTPHINKKWNVRDKQQTLIDEGWRSHRIAGCLDGFQEPLNMLWIGFSFQMNNVLRGEN